MSVRLSVGDPPFLLFTRYPDMNMPLGLGAILEQHLKQPTVDKIIPLQRHENELLRELKSIVDTLKTQMVRVKTEGVKDSVIKHPRSSSPFAPS